MSSKEEMNEDMKEDVTIQELELLENVIDSTQDPLIPSSGVCFKDFQANDGGGFNTKKRKKDFPYQESTIVKQFKNYEVKPEVRKVIKQVVNETDDIEENDDKFNQLQEISKKQVSYQELKSTFEKDNFKIIQGAIYGWINSNKNLILRKKSDVVHHYNNLFYYEKVSIEERKKKIDYFQKSSFINKWLKDENMRTYEYIDFIPFDTYNPRNNKHTYNLWKGFKAEKYEPINDTDKVNKLIEPIINHLKEVICGEHYIFMIQYLASIIQRPSIPTGVIVLIQGLQGTGKGLIFDTFRINILGELLSKQTEGLAPIFDRFSNAMLNKLLIQADEINMSEFLNHNIKEKLKNRATVRTIQYKKKGIDPFDIKNYANFILTTNNYNSAVIPFDDTRFVVFEANDKYLHNAKYLTDLHNHLKKEEVSRAFFEYLLSVDLSNIYNFQVMRPKTDYYNVI